MEINGFVAVSSIVLAILGNVVAIAYMSGRLNNRVDNIQRSIDRMADDQRSMSNTQSTMGERLARMEGRRREDH